MGAIEGAFRSFEAIVTNAKDFVVKGYEQGSETLDNFAEAYPVAFRIASFVVSLAVFAACFAVAPTISTLCFALTFSATLAKPVREVGAEIFEQMRDLWTRNIGEPTAASKTLVGLAIAAFVGIPAAIAGTASYFAGKYTGAGVAYAASLIRREEVPGN